MSGTSINTIQDEIIEEFGLFDEPMDRYDYLIDIGKRLPLMEDKFKTEENIVKGCQSTVWLHAAMEDDKVVYQADSNTVITKGIIGLLVRVLSGHAPDEIVNADLYFIDKIELRSHLSSQRSNGLNAMLKQMKLYALGFQQLSLKNA
ncbi:MAG: SufE family protein [Chitinophagales bacterium]|nr:SufE family protein [Chitinophagales bacterium]